MLTEKLMRFRLSEIIWNLTPWWGQKQVSSEDNTDTFMFYNTLPRGKIPLVPTSIFLLLKKGKFVFSNVVCERYNAAKIAADKSTYTHEVSYILTRPLALHGHVMGQMSETCFMSRVPAWGKCRSKSHSHTGFITGDQTDIFSRRSE